MKNRIALTILGTGLCFAACSTQIISTQDPTRNLTSYKTYQWLTQDDARNLQLNNPKIDYLSGTTTIVRSPELEAQVKARIEEDLNKLGYQQAPEGEKPDFYATYYAKAPNDDWVSSWKGTTPSVMDVPVVIFPDFSRPEAYLYREGMVYMVMYDPKTQRPAWTGRYSLPSRERTLSETEVSTVVDELVSQFKNSA